MIRGTLCRGRAYAPGVIAGSHEWVLASLSPPGSPPTLGFVGGSTPTPPPGSAVARHADSLSDQRGVGRSTTDPKGGRVGLRTPLLNDARRGLRQRLADVLAMPQPIANSLELALAVLSRELVTTADRR